MFDMGRVLELLGYMRRRIALTIAVLALPMTLAGVFLYRTSTKSDSGFWALAILGLLATFSAIDSINLIWTNRKRPSIERMVRIAQWPRSLHASSVGASVLSPYARLLVVFGISYVCVSVALLAGLGFAMALMPEVFKQWRLDQPIVSLSHWFGLTTIVILLAATVTLGKKNTEKHRRLLRIQRTIGELSPIWEQVLAVKEAPQDTQKEGIRDGNHPVIAAIQKLLEHVLQLTDRQLRLQRVVYKSKPPKSAWIWIRVPGSNAFRVVHACPDIAAYRRVQEVHRPAMWDHFRVNEIDRGVAAVQGGLGKEASGERSVQRLTELREQLLECASLVGYVYEVGGPVFLPRIELAGVNLSYTRLLPAGPSSTKYRFRSASGIRLELGDQRLGVLMLYDTVSSGFLPADAATVEIFGGLVSPLLAKALALGLYTDGRTVYR